MKKFVRYVESEKCDDALHSFRRIELTQSELNELLISDSELEKHLKSAWKINIYPKNIVEIIKSKRNKSRMIDPNILSEITKNLIKFKNLDELKELKCDTYCAGCIHQDMDYFCTKLLIPINNSDESCEFYE